MLNKFWLAPVMASFVFMAGCGGGGGGGSGESTGVPVEPRNDVAGPLDGWQEPMSQQVVSPLSAAFVGTPLAGVMACFDRAAIGDLSDMLDALAVGIAPGASLAAATSDVQAEMGDLVGDLQGFVSSLAGGTGCGDSPRSASVKGNPLRGTALAAVGAEVLPVLAQVKRTLAAAPAGSMSFGDLAVQVGLIAQSFAIAQSQLPSSAVNAPVVGPVLSVVAISLTQTQSALEAAAGGDPQAVGDAIASTVRHFMDGLLTDVVPIVAIETASGSPGLVSGQIEWAVYNLTEALAGGIATNSNSAMAPAISSLTHALVDPLATHVFPTLLDPMHRAVSAAPGSDSGSLTGTPLDPALARIHTLLSSDAGRDPMNELLGWLLNYYGDSCPLAGTPLEGMCGTLVG